MSNARAEESRPRALDDWSTSEIRVGTEARKELFRRTFLDTFDPYKPAIIDWPPLEGAALARLTGLPFWGMAVETESETAMRMQLYAANTKRR